MKMVWVLVRFGLLYGFGLVTVASALVTWGVGWGWGVLLASLVVLASAGAGLIVEDP